jgi:hypothetical protein
VVQEEVNVVVSVPVSHVLQVCCLTHESQQAMVAHGFGTVASYRRLREGDLKEIAKQLKHNRVVPRLGMMQQFDIRADWE